MVFQLCAATNLWGQYLRGELLWDEVRLIMKGVVRPVRKGAGLALDKGGYLSELLACL